MSGAAGIVGQGLNIGTQLYSTYQNRKLSKQQQALDQKFAGMQQNQLIEQEIKQQTFEAIKDVSAPEWQTFYEYTLKSDNANDILSVAKEAIKRYRERVGDDPSALGVNTDTALQNQMLLNLKTMQNKAREIIPMDYINNPSMRKYYIMGVVALSIGLYLRYRKR